MFKLLVDSNDNFTLNVYSDKLIKLPIKIGTLDFHQIADSSIKKLYQVNVPSAKIKQTINNSYEIVKYFTLRQFSQIQNKQNFYIEFRAQIIPTQNRIFKNQNDQYSKAVFQQNMYEDKFEYDKIQLLSFSKWNRNNFNNIVVEYIDNKNNKQECKNFEIIWDIKQAYSRIINYSPTQGRKIKNIIVKPVALNSIFPKSLNNCHGEALMIINFISMTIANIDKISH